MKNIYMYVQDTMADFEHGYLMHALSLQTMLGEPKVKLLDFVRRVQTFENY